MTGSICRRSPNWVFVAAMVPGGSSSALDAFQLMDVMRKGRKLP